MIISIILAAGEGTRMKSKIPKALHKITGRPLISHVVNAAKGAMVDKNIVVIGHGKELFIDSIKEDGIQYVTQPIGQGAPYGTGFAVMLTKDYIEDDSYVIILYGDTPLITSDTINELLEFHKKGNYTATVLTAEFDDATGYGRIIRDDNDTVIAIVEHRDANDEVRKIKEINSGIYCFEGRRLREVLDKLNNNNVQNEYYITDAVKILSDQGYIVGGCKIKDNSELLGVNSRNQLAEAELVMRKRINDKLMAEGVTIIDPNNTYIEEEVKIGRDTILYPGVILAKIISISL